MPEESVAVAPPPPSQEAPPAPQPSGGEADQPAVDVTPAAIDGGPQHAQPKPGSAKERMFKELRKKYGGETDEPEKPVKTKESDEEPAVVEGEQNKADAKVDPGSKTEAGTEKASADKKKVSPWKLVDEHKAARAKAEQELSDIRKTIGDPAALKKQIEGIQAIQKRNQELEEEIRYVNYQKSTEFKEKYQKPYEDAWKKWMNELGELMVTDEASGAERQIQPQDLLELVNMPLQRARAHAQDVYGAFANDVMNARKEIKGLFDNQQKALEDARKTSDGWQAKIQQDFKQRRETVSKEIGDSWTRANQSALTDEKFGKFFKPVEGDEEGNQRLTKGFELADRAFSVNPFDPRLSPEQRAEIVQLHAAVRNRAAAFGRLSLQNSRLEQKIAKLTEELNKYKSAEPPAAGGETAKPNGEHATSAKDQVFGALRKFMH